MRKGYLLLAVMVVLGIYIYPNYSQGFITLTQALSGFLVITVTSGFLIEVLSMLKKLLIDALGGKSPRKA